MNGYQSQTLSRGPCPATIVTGTSAKARTYTAQTVAKLVAQGHTVIVCQRKVYDITKCRPFHPGGILTLDAMNGCDVTDILEVFHPRGDALARLPAYYIGDYIPTPVYIPDPALAKLAASASTFSREEEESLLALVDSDTEQRDSLVADYLRLHRSLFDLGFYQTDYWFYFHQLLYSTAVISVALGLLVCYPGSLPHLLISALLLAFFWHCLSFAAHDAGHHSITCNTRIDDVIGIFIASCCGGLSFSWWAVSHNVHHVVTNEPENDPDIQHLPFIAVSTRFFDSLYSTFHRRDMKFDAFAKFFVSFQHYLFLPILSFGRFNLYAQSLNHLFNFSHPDGKKHRWFELAGIACFWAWYGYWVLFCQIPSWHHRFIYFYVSHAATMILHLQISLSHFAMSTESPGKHESFLMKALRTTMNIDCPEWFDWFHGGLQFQIEHHLFPRVPRVHFRKLRRLVKEFCTKHSLQYCEYTFIHGQGKVLSLLADIAHQVQFLASNADSTKRFQKRSKT